MDFETRSILLAEFLVFVGFLSGSLLAARLLAACLLKQGRLSIRKSRTLSQMSEQGSQPVKAIY